MQRSLRDEHGAIDFVKLLMFAAVVAAGYLAWVYVPLYIDDYTVKTAMHRAANAAYADRRMETVESILRNGFKEAAMMNEELARDGSTIKRPFDIDNSLWSVGFTKLPPAVTIEINYERHFVLPFLKKERVVKFHHLHTEDLSEIKY